MDEATVTIPEVKGVGDCLSGKASRDAGICGPPTWPEDEGYEDSLEKGNLDTGPLESTCPKTSKW